MLSNGSLWVSFRSLGSLLGLLLLYRIVAVSAKITPVVGCSTVSTQMTQAFSSGGGPVAAMGPPLGYVDLYGSP